MSNKPCAGAKPIFCTSNCLPASSPHITKLNRELNLSSTNPTACLQLLLMHITFLLQTQNPASSPPTFLPPCLVSSYPHPALASPRLPPPRLKKKALPPGACCTGACAGGAQAKTNPEKSVFSDLIKYIY